MGYCDCDWEDGPTVMSCVTVKAARKPRTCTECGAPIKAGDSYQRIWGIWNGDQGRSSICAGCLEMLEWAQISVPCFCYSYDKLHETIAEMVDEVRHEVPGFYFEYGRRVIALRRRGSTYYAKRRRRLRKTPENGMITA